ncbi:cytochrome c oxidase subunit 3 [Streptomyces acidicola]|uniref:cytochrome c oxidase subunit 3 n=1 Tax=Streptomyces acidicola TaxID=2596892 RepID=UPI00380D5786
MTDDVRRSADLFVDPFSALPRGAPVERPPGRFKVPGEAGIWVFIFGDLLLFSLFFGVLVHERSRDADLYELGRSGLNLSFGAVNTLLLLTGSLFVVRGLEALRQGDSKRGARMILATLACGLCFVVDKCVEYATEVGAGHTPSSNSFYMYYYVFTGIHLLHLLLGMVALVIMYRLARAPRTTAGSLRLLEAGACYWHLVDVLWIVLFALLYLMR